MAEDLELAEMFFKALKGGYVPYIEDTYRQYKEYIRTLDSLDYYIIYNHDMVSKVDEAYQDWKAKNSVGD